MHRPISTSKRAGSSRGYEVAVAVAGFATARASNEQLAGLRKTPGLAADVKLSPSFLKNSDDQTVLALATIAQAMASLNKPTRYYQDWGIVSAATLFGRAGTMQSVSEFKKDGPWGITPHMIPHHSLHAVSGTISLVLNIKGPNFGIGGGPEAAAEAFLVAATLISERNIPGLWVVLTAHDPEYVPGIDGQSQRPSGCCLSAALALEPPTSAGRALYLHIRADEDSHADWPKLTVPAFLEALESVAQAQRFLKTEQRTLRLDGRHWALPGGSLYFSNTGVEGNP